MHHLLLQPYAKFTYEFIELILWPRIKRLIFIPTPSWCHLFVAIISCSTYKSSSCLKYHDLML